MIKTRFELVVFADNYTDALSKINKKLSEFLGDTETYPLNLVDMDVIVTDSNDETAFEFKITAHIKLKN